MAWCDLHNLRSYSVLWISQSRLEVSRLDQWEAAPPPLTLSSDPQSDQAGLTPPHSACSQSRARLAARAALLCFARICKLSRAQITESSELRAPSAEVAATKHHLTHAPTPKENSLICMIHYQDFYSLLWKIHFLILELCHVSSSFSMKKEQFQSLKHGIKHHNNFPFINIEFHGL